MQRGKGPLGLEKGNRNAATGYLTPASKAVEWAWKEHLFLFFGSLQGSWEYPVSWSGGTGLPEKREKSGECRGLNIRRS